MGRLLGHVEQDLDAKKGRYEQKLQELDEESRVSAEDGPCVSELAHTAGGIAAEEVGGRASRPRALRKARGGGAGGDARGRGRESRRETREGAGERRGTG